MPWAGPVPFAYVSVSPSTSVQARVPPIAVSSFPRLPLLAQTGASLTGVTVIETVAELLRSPSLAVNVKLSRPL